MTRTWQHSSGTSVNGIADHDAGGQRGAVPLEALAFADQVAVAAGLGDELVAADQRRDHDAGDHRPDAAVEQRKEETRRRARPVSAKSTCG